MIFSSLTFVWIFLPVVLIGNYLIYRFGTLPLCNLFLLAASLVFYGAGEPVYLFLMLASILANWAAGAFMDSAGRVYGAAGRKAVLTASLVFNLGTLGIFKYAGLAARTLNLVPGLSVPVLGIALPVGISFFTFQAMSYVIDVYRGECRPQKNILNLALYISFFPQLIAGPIVKYRDVETRISSRRISAGGTAEGIRRFVLGFGKKVLLANILGQCADGIWGADISRISGITAWAGALMYTFQIYYDFSGYSDMAIGLGKMFGFEFRENFRYPYLSCSIREFWRRWHISLSSWFKDYLYIPLGGSRKGAGKTYRNLALVFLATGLWHGADYTFLFWGMFHGALLILERSRFGEFLEKHRKAGFLYTFFLVNTGWVFFRADSIRAALRYLKRMFLPWLYSGTGYALREFVDPRMAAALFCGILGMGILPAAAKRLGMDMGKCRFSVPELFWLLVVWILSVAALAGAGYNPFIYYRF